MLLSSMHMNDDARLCNPEYVHDVGLSGWGLGNGIWALRRFGPDLRQDPALPSEPLEPGFSV